MANLVPETHLNLFLKPIYDEFMIYWTLPLNLLKVTVSRKIQIFLHKLQNPDVIQISLTGEFQMLTGTKWGHDARKIYNISIYCT